MSMDTMVSTTHAVRERLYIVCAGGGRRHRLATGSGGAWVVAAIERYERRADLLRGKLRLACSLICVHVLQRSELASPGS
jgi:hypothetical protein